MITIHVDRQMASDIRVDRDSQLNADGREGFVIDVAVGVRIAFDDEQDASALAKMILHRLGE